jgi:hypothetical protein
MPIAKYEICHPRVVFRECNAKNSKVSLPCEWALLKAKSLTNSLKYLQVCLDVC